jgi:hypothetical protein
MKQQKLYFDKRKIKKEFDAVQFMREQRDRISAEICNLSREQILEYFKSRIPKERIIPTV